LTMPSNGGLGISGSAHCATSGSTRLTLGNFPPKFRLREINMKFSKRVLAGMAVTAAFVLSAVVAPVATAAGNSSATGGGTAEEAGGLSTFVFNAVKKGDGTVTGHLVYQVRGLPITFMMALDCLIVAGNVATMSGVVTHVSEEIPGFIFVGQEGVFQVVDNGQGADAAPDLYSDLFLGPGESCINYPYPPAHIPISGNVQVR
jgi:hypothetical protein